MMENMMLMIAVIIKMGYIFLGCVLGLITLLAFIFLIENREYIKRKISNI